jgi:hypothetical protein
MTGRTILHDRILEELRLSKFGCFLSSTVLDLSRFLAARLLSFSY